MIPQAEHFLRFFVFKIQASLAEIIFVASCAKIVCAVKWNFEAHSDLFCPGIPHHNLRSRGRFNKHTAICFYNKHSSGTRLSPDTRPRSKLWQYLQRIFFLPVWGCTVTGNCQTTRHLTVCTSCSQCILGIVFRSFILSRPFRGSRSDPCS